jgi:hypothetical protein
MTIKIKRQTGWTGMATRLRVKLNGKEVDKVEFDQTIDVELPYNQTELSVSQFLTTSDKVKVSDGDTVLVTTRTLNIVFVAVVIALMAITPPIFSIENLSARLLIMLLFVPLALTAGFRLHKLELTHPQVNKNYTNH